MAEARQRSEWSRTSEILAMIANTQRDPKKRPRPYAGVDFDPYRKKSDYAVPMKLSEMGAMFRGSRQRKGEPDGDATHQDQRGEG